MLLGDGLLQLGEESLPAEATHSRLPMVLAPFSGSADQLLPPADYRTMTLGLAELIVSALLVLGPLAGVWLTHRHFRLTHGAERRAEKRKELFNDVATFAAMAHRLYDEVKKAGPAKKGEDDWHHFASGEARMRIDAAERDLDVAYSRLALLVSDPLTAVAKTHYEKIMKFRVGDWYRVDENLLRVPRQRGRILLTGTKRVGVVATGAASSGGVPRV